MYEACICCALSRLSYFWNCWSARPAGKWMQHTFFLHCMQALLYSNYSFWIQYRKWKCLHRIFSITWIVPSTFWSLYASQMRVMFWTHSFYIRLYRLYTFCSSAPQGNRHSTMTPIFYKAYLMRHRLPFTKLVLIFSDLVQFPASTCNNSCHRLFRTCWIPACSADRKPSHYATWCCYHSTTSGWFHIHRISIHLTFH